MTEIRPDYYKSGGIEAFDVIDAFDLNFNLGNAFKYIARAGKKGDKAEDLRKAVTYLNREIEKEEKKENMLKVKMSVNSGIIGTNDLKNITDKIVEGLKENANKESDYEAGRQENL